MDTLFFWMTSFFAKIDNQKMPKNACVCWYNDTHSRVFIIFIVVSSIVPEHQTHANQNSNAQLDWTPHCFWNFDFASFFLHNATKFWWLKKQNFTTDVSAKWCKKYEMFDVWIPLIKGDLDEVMIRYDLTLQYAVPLTFFWVL